MRMPPNTLLDLAEPLRAYWQRRLDTHTHDSYRGRTLAKMPEDIRTYWHILEGTRPEVIVEIGSYEGGSAVWFADHLDILGCAKGKPSVISIDHQPIDYGDDDRIAFIQGDVGATDVIGQARQLVGGRRAMVSEDSAHTHETTRAALRGYSDMVSKGCYFVVEDGVVDDEVLRLDRYPRGVQPAIEEFLKSEQGQRFTRHWYAPYGLTTCIGGWLEAIA